MRKVKALTVLTALIGILSAFTSLRAESWIMTWREVTAIADTLWDVKAYVERDIFFNNYRRAVFVGSYVANYIYKYGMAGTWNLDSAYSPVKGVRWFKSDGNVIDFQSVDPIYVGSDPAERTVSKFWVAGYSHIRTEGRDTNIIITKLDRNLNHLYTKEYDFGSGVDVLYKIYTVNYPGVASNDGVIRPIINGFAAIGYTTYGASGDENILFVAGDTSGDIFTACVFKTLGTARDVGMGLYEIEPGTFLAVGYTNFTGAYSPIVIKFTVGVKGCDVAWVRIYMADGYKLIPYAIDRTLYIEGAMYNIIGTALPLYYPSGKVGGFRLAIDGDGNLMGIKLYYPDSRRESEGLVLFDEYVDTTSNQIITVGSWYPYGLTDSLRRFIENQGSQQPLRSPRPANVIRNKALILTLSNSGDTLGARIYGFTYPDHVKHTLLFAVSNIDDTTLISAGSFYDAGIIGSKPQYYAIKTSKPPLDQQPLCSRTLKIRYIQPDVRVYSPLIRVSTVYPSKYLIDLTTEDPYYGGGVCTDTYDGGGKLTSKAVEEGTCGSPEIFGPYKVFNSSGYLVKRGSGRVDLKGLPKGIYFIKWGRVVKRVVKVK